MAQILQLSADVSVGFLDEFREFTVTVSSQAKDVWLVEVEDNDTGVEWEPIRFQCAHSPAPRMGPSLALMKAINLLEAHLRDMRPWECFDGTV